MAFDGREQGAGSACAARVRAAWWPAMARRARHAPRQGRDTFIPGLRSLPAVLAITLLTGCALPFSGDRADPGDILPPEARLHYVTDRAPAGEAPRADVGPAYGAGRSAAMAYGTLSAGDGAGGRARVTEALRFPQTPLPFSIRRGRPVTDPTAPAPTRMPAAASASGSRRRCARAAAR